MKVHLVFLTYNRLAYTRLALPALLKDSTEEFSLTIWDNGSTDGTRDYLRTVKDRRIVDVVFAGRNRGQAYVTNTVWSQTSADLVGKVDNDCLVTSGWTRILTRAHEDMPNLGVVGCWHFPAGDFDYTRSVHKIQTFGEHRILRHPWVDGSALLVKRRTFLEHAPCADNEYLSGFWIRLALAGRVNGYYYPLIHQEHMDYPWSKYFAYSDDFDGWLKTSTTLIARGIRTPEEAREWHRIVIGEVLDGPWQVMQYLGWRGKLRQWRGGFRRMLVGMRVARRRMGCAE
jgi:GT2 family glycosyltransferase